MEDTEEVLNRESHAILGVRMCDRQMAVVWSLCSWNMKSLTTSTPFEHHKLFYKQKVFSQSLPYLLETINKERSRASGLLALSYLLRYVPKSVLLSQQVMACFSVCLICFHLND